MRAQVQRYEPNWFVVGVVALGACGGSASTETVTVTTSAGTPTAAPAPRTPAKSSGHTHPPRRHTRSSSASARFTSCDANIRVKVGTTSCGFGQNVFYGFWKARDEGHDAFEAYSTVSQRSYAMDCTTGTTVICRAGDGGQARFPMAAVDSYDAGQAARFFASHDLGPCGFSPFRGRFRRLRHRRRDHRCHSVEHKPAVRRQRLLQS